jgi:hypothetical protein
MSDELEIKLLQSKIDNLECRVNWLEGNWVDWVKSTKDMGQKLIIALEGKVNEVK